MKINYLFLVLYFLLFSGTILAGEKPLVIGSKRFTESYILGEIIKIKAEEAKETPVVHKPGLGNTGIVFAALKEGLIDLYPEYTGTIQRDILDLPATPILETSQLNRLLKPLGLGIDVPLGFSNNYALAVRQDLAEELNLRSISDLKKHPELVLGFSQEFLERSDGWKGLQKAYQLPQQTVKGIDHSLSYAALNHNQIHVTDIYTTDSKIKKHHLKILEDDLHFFPPYQAVILYRLDVPKNYPRTWDKIKQLEEQISENEMKQMNGQAELEGQEFSGIASRYLKGEVSQQSQRESLWSRLFAPDLWLLTKQHLMLVSTSLALAILIGIPLGILAFLSAPFAHFILPIVGLIQTIPSLAMLAFLIPLLHQVGVIPAIVALFLYALLPIVRNTYSGLQDIPIPLRESATALGLPIWPSLYLIELPLATRTILSGIKISAIMNVGTATIAAFIGAGGYGDRIVAGLALNDHLLLLAGAIPACFMALLIHLLFDSFDFLLIRNKG